MRIFSTALWFCISALTAGCDSNATFTDPFSNPGQGSTTSTGTTGSQQPSPSPSPSPSPTHTVIPSPSPSPSPSSSPAASGGTSIFNCGTYNAWSTSNFPANGCGVNNAPYPNASTDFLLSHPTSGAVNASSVQLVPANGDHDGWGLVYYDPVNVQAFSTTFAFVPNGFNLAFTLNNAYTPGGGFDFPWAFNAGAGGEAGFTQFAGISNFAPYNLFAIEFDSYSPLTDTGVYTYSSVQMYQSSQACSLPAMVAPTYPNYLPGFATNKISTSPVPLNSPLSSGAAQAVASTDTFLATIIYTGTNVTVQLYDVTAGGSCPGSSCFTYTWQGVNVPGITGGPWTNYIDGTSGVGGVNAYAGLNAGTSLSTGPALQILSWNYNVLSPAAAPTFSLPAGSYAGTQSVTISDSSSGAIICYSTEGPPSTNGTTGCTNGTLYSGAISVSSGQTLYAVAGGAGYADSAIFSAAYQINSTASQPTFNPPAGTYQGTQTVYLSAPSGQSIYYNMTGSPTCSSTAYTSPITVSSNETIYAIACGSGLASSLVGQATYTLNPFAGSGAPNPASAPTFSPPPGTYSGAQTVTISSTTPGSYICYTLSATKPAIPPQPDNGRAELPPNGSTPVPGGCNSGTYYTGPITISSSTTLYAITGTTLSSLPSSLVAVPYIINP